MNNRDIQWAFEEGERIDQAMNRGFFEAVRLHRLHGIPLVVWDEGAVRYLDPHTIVLPEEKEAQPQVAEPARHERLPGSRNRRRTA